MISYIRTGISFCKSAKFTCIFPYVPMAPPRFRSYCFTWNNPGANTEQLLESLPGYTYLCFGRESAATTGTRHLQGFIRFKHGRSITSVRRDLAGAHVERAITTTAAIEYCQKDGDFVEFGTRPVDDASRGDDEIQRWQETWDYAKKGEIENIPPDIRVRSYSAIRRIEKDYMERPGQIPEVCGVWVFGPSGAGKTHAIFQKYPEVYTKNASKNWDGYQNHDCVLFDDMDPECGKWCGKFFKHWADKYPFIADNKGGSIFIRPKLFIVTSQYTIEECFFGQQQTIDAITRRFRFVNFVDRNTDIELPNF